MDAQSGEDLSTVTSTAASSQPGRGTVRDPKLALPSASPSLVISPERRGTKAGDKKTIKRIHCGKSKR